MFAPHLGADGSFTPCLGGREGGVGGVGYCVEGTHGPRCEVCIDETEFFDFYEARCKQCPTTGDLLLFSGSHAC